MNPGGYDLLVGKLLQCGPDRPWCKPRLCDQLLLRQITFVLQCLITSFALGGDLSDRRYEGRASAMSTACCGIPCPIDTLPYWSAFDSVTANVRIVEETTDFSIVSV